MNELISHCVQVEGRLNKDKEKSVHLAFTSKGKDKGKKKKKIRKLQIQHFKNNNNKEPSDLKSIGCFFCELKGTRRNIAPIITHGVLRNVCFLV